MPPLLYGTRAATELLEKNYSFELTIRLLTNIYTCFTEKKEDIDVNKRYSVCPIKLMVEASENEDHQPLANATNSEVSE